MGHSQTMTSRQRWLAALRCQPVDRLPFWPKIGGAYVAAQAEPFSRMSVDDLHAWIGSDPQLAGGNCVREVRRRTSLETIRHNGTRTTIFHTPYGDLTAEEAYDPASQSWHPRQFPVKSADDIDRMLAFQADASYELDRQGLEQSRELVQRAGERGCPAASIGVSPLMDWLQHLAGLEQGHFLLADYPDKVAALFEVMHQGLRRKAEILATHSPCDVIYSTENTSTTLLSPALFRRWCWPHLADYGRIVTAAGKIHMLHMCGHLKALLPDIARLPAAGIEAYTSPPVGDTHLADGRRVRGDLCLVGGTSAWLWTRSRREIIAHIEQELSALPHTRGIIVTSAGVMPPVCPPATIREVCAWVQSRPAT